MLFIPDFPQLLGRRHRRRILASLFGQRQITSYYNCLTNAESFNAQLGASTTLAAGAKIGGKTLDSGNYLVTASGSTLVVTKAAHDGKMILLTRAAGVAVTMPAATGTGSTYIFVNDVAVSGGSHTITAASASDLYYGIYEIGKSATAAVPFVPNGSSNYIMTINGTTQGGAGIGDIIVMTDIGTNAWLVEGLGFGSSAIATPFSG